MNPRDEMRCDNCFYRNEQNSTCHVNPPVMSTTSHGEWPYVQGHEWCGEFWSLADADKKQALRFVDDSVV